VNRPHERRKQRSPWPPAACRDCVSLPPRRCTRVRPAWPAHSTGPWTRVLAMPYGLPCTPIARTCSGCDIGIESAFAGPRSRSSARQVPAQRRAAMQLVPAAAHSSSSSLRRSSAIASARARSARLRAGPDPPARHPASRPGAAIMQRTKSVPDPGRSSDSSVRHDVRTSRQSRRLLDKTPFGAP